MGGGRTHIFACRACWAIDQVSLSEPSFVAVKGKFDR